jgi:membrane protein
MSDAPSDTNGDGPDQATRRRKTVDLFGALFGFVVYVGLRFREDNCQQRASALTYTTLLAMVPLLAVSFAIFSAFPAFERLEDRVMDMIFDQIPQVGDQVRDYLEQFTAQTGSLTAIGIIFLAATAIMLLVTISGTFNTIWRVEQNRGLVARMLVFWAVLTLAPMLLGASFSLSTYLFAVARATGVDTVAGGLANLAFMVTFLMQTAGLMVLYLFMPNFPVRPRDALVGGLVAAILLDLLKRGFGFYVTQFPTYETIYGAMATVPIFLIWMYLSWMVILFGAEVAAGLPEWRSGIRRPQKEGLPPVQRLSAALSLLNALLRASRDGETLSSKRLSRAGVLGPLAMAWATRKLEQRKYISKTDRNAWVLSRDLSETSLADLYTDLDIDLSGRVPRGHLNTAWGSRFSSVLSKMGDARDDIMATDLKSLLAPPEVGEEPLPGEEEDEVEDKAAQRSFNRRVLALIGLGTLGQAG